MKEQIIIIKSTHTLEDIEKDYDFLIRNPSANLKIPLSLKKNTFSLVPSLIQFVCTWHRINSIGIVYTDLNEKGLNTDLQAKELISDYFAYASILFLWKHNIVGTNGENVKSWFINNAVQVNSLMNNLGVNHLTRNEGNFFFKNSSIFLTCFDHVKPENGLLHGFYSNEGKFISHSKELSFLWEHGVEKFIFTEKAGYSKSINNKIRDNILEIIFQLMENTNAWARTDENNGGLNPNIRGVYIKLHKSTRTNFIDDYQKQAGLQKYFESSSLKEAEDKLLHFLEISVFDSGPGFVRRFTSSPDTVPRGEVDIIKKCLTKYNTSDINTGRQRGFGLPLVMNTLNGKGFFRLRTSRCALYRDLIHNEFDEINENTSDKLTLYDWESAKSTYSILCKTEGVVFTAVYPITFN